MSASMWILAATVVAGLGLSCFYLLEKPIVGRAWFASLAHGTAGAIGVALFLLSLASAGGDSQGFGRIAAWGLGIALLAGLVVFATQMRRRRPAGLLIAFHAMMGMAGFTILLAYASLPH